MLQNCFLEKADMLFACFKPGPLTYFHKQIANVKQGVNMEEWEIAKC